MELRDLLPEPRSVEDVLSKRIRLLFDGEEFVLPVLPIAANRDWNARLSVEVRAVFDDLDQTSDPGPIFDLLARTPGRFMDLLVSYDRDGILPPLERIEEVWTEVDLLMACLEVWRAANPLVDIGVVVIATTERRMNEWQQRMSSPLLSGDGPTTTSTVS